MRILPISGGLWLSHSVEDDRRSTVLPLIPIPHASALCLRAMHASRSTGHSSPKRSKGFSSEKPLPFISLAVLG
jgi:hypothetical protein